MSNEKAAEDIFTAPASNVGKACDHGDMMPLSDFLGVVGTQPLTFSDLTDEAWREYTFPSGAKVRIENPVGLHVTKKPGGDTHRIIQRVQEAGSFTFVERSHYIPAGWIHLEWQVKDGKPPFAF